MFWWSSTHTNRPKVGYGPDRTDVGQPEPDRTDPSEPRADQMDPDSGPDRTDPSQSLNRLWEPWARSKTSQGRPWIRWTQKCASTITELRFMNSNFGPEKELKQFWQKNTKTHCSVIDLRCLFSRLTICC